MILEISKNVLINKMNKLKCAVSNFAKVYISDKNLYVETSNNEIQARVKLLENVDEDLSVNLSNHFIQMMDKLPGKDVKLDFGISALKIVCGTSESTLKYVENKNILMNYSYGQELNIVGLKKIVKKASISVAKGNVGEMPVLAGINVKSTKKEIVIRSCDRYRLSQYKTPVDSSATDVDIIIINHNLSKVLDAIDDNFRMYVNKGNLLISSDDVVYILRLIEGDYPKVESFIPTSFKYSISFGKEEILSVLERCSIFCETGNDFIKVLIADDKLSIIKDSQIGSLFETIQAKSDVSEEMEIALSLNYLKAAISAYDGKVKAVFNSSSSPILILSEDENIDSNLIQMVLPVRIG